MYPVGRLSVTETPVASLGPLLVTSSVNMIVSPTFGVALSTDFTICKSELQAINETKTVSNNSTEQFVAKI